uniref:Uncharacterized protein n=1 Tax=Anguilla anguilla TaxID=7936 RepID=A0A0E9USZ6_ANGAN
MLCGPLLPLDTPLSFSCIRTHLSLYRNPLLQTHLNSFFFIVL